MLLALRAVAGCRSCCHVPILQAGEGLERLSEWVGRPYRWAGGTDKGQEAEGLACAHLRSQHPWDRGAPLFHVLRVGRDCPEVRGSGVGEPRGRGLLCNPDSAHSPSGCSR